MTRGRAMRKALVTASWLIAAVLAVYQSGRQLGRRWFK
ncbi:MULTISPECIES: hydrolase [Lactiplantibacillus]|uniref:Hydrolase n=1 Tax=Lactiplantibacillus pentosus TaxID=1589 RepID=A0ABD7INZ4_LACPE|nr:MULTISPECIES: hydrolase [Lactiplantibacillus]MCC3163479.1 hydrolase [Lactiplantibacillus pentosus]MCJ8188499.1 hydrolase [Lactiplantibacillus pentosus]MCM8608975.1 hydrolase [Lactiplantibacillus sp. B652]PRO93980.1 hydrolase [Lactiplantibacillus pentosus]RMW46392.1 hydrolase [Lactiplantibacillus pentosus]